MRTCSRSVRWPRKIVYIEASRYSLAVFARQYPKKLLYCGSDHVKWRETGYQHVFSCIDHCWNELKVTVYLENLKIAVVARQCAIILLIQTIPSPNQMKPGCVSPFLQYISLVHP